MARSPEKAREHYLKNKSKYLERAKAWALKNPERVKENYAKWLDENRHSYNKGQLKYRKENPKKHLYTSCKQRALKKNREFTIAIEDLPEIPKICPLLGIEINSFAKELSHHPSIDRKNSNLGYVPGNVWFISQRANMLKNNSNGLELLHLAINLLEIEGELN